jgi:putative membrane-bound dehydrogenase-like protein
MHKLAVIFAALFSTALAVGQDVPIAPAEAPKHMTVPEGFHVSLFAGEPDVVQPIAFTFDDRGRLWVAECFSYPKWITDGSPGKDRILIFEDDGTGHFKNKKVFAETLTNVSGFEIGFGGVWVCSTPNLLFIPMNPGEDKPAGPAQVILDGWAFAQHNVFNRLTWGPDGWLYGCNGILQTSHVGKPGTPDDQRVPLNCGVWRYHPVRKTFEVFAWGTTNPWGLDFDDYGQMFITNCVIKHLFHFAQGGHYQRMFGNDLNPYAYGLMESCADHIHWAGGDWTSSRGGQGEHSKAGGGHAHAGAMVYLGDNWPDAYRNSIFMCNIHGNRVNHDVLQHKGSGYLAHHAPDFLLANDPWFRGLNLMYGPDGGVFVSDWSDTGECHNYQTVDPSNGRIYKVVYGQTKKVDVDVAKASDSELVQLQLHHNDWFVRHARRNLQERAAAGKLESTTAASLRNIFETNNDVTRKLRALWALNDIGALDDSYVREYVLTHAEPYVRGWGIQLALEGRQPSEELLTKLADLAKNDPSPVVRLYLASGLQRIEVGRRWPIATALAAHGEDATDPNLPLMLYFGIERMAAADPNRATELLVKTKIPIVRQYLAQRIAG